MDNQERVGVGSTHVFSLNTESETLRAQLEELSGERDRLVETQQTIMRLMGTSKADKIVHDLRNILNERDLLKTLLDHN